MGRKTTKVKNNNKIRGCAGAITKSQNNNFRHIIDIYLLNQHVHNGKKYFFKIFWLAVVMETKKWRPYWIFIFAECLLIYRDKTVQLGVYIIYIIPINLIEPNIW